MAVFGELSAPVTKWLELTGALRYDHYSDFGDSLTPKVGFKVKPIDTVAIRGTYSEAQTIDVPCKISGMTRLPRPYECPSGIATQLRSRGRIFVDLRICAPSARGG